MHHYGEGRVVSPALEDDRELTDHSKTARSPGSEDKQAQVISSL